MMEDARRQEEELEKQKRAEAEKESADRIKQIDRELAEHNKRVQQLAARSETTLAGLELQQKVMRERLALETGIPVEEIIKATSAAAKTKEDLEKEKEESEKKKRSEAAKEGARWRKINADTAKAQEKREKEQQEKEQREQRERLKKQAAEETSRARDNILLERLVQSLDNRPLEDAGIVQVKETIEPLAPPQQNKPRQSEKKGVPKKKRTPIARKKATAEVEQDEELELALRNSLDTS